MRRFLVGDEEGEDEAELENRVIFLIVVWLLFFFVILAATAILLRLAVDLATGLRVEERGIVYCWCGCECNCEWSVGAR